MSTVREAAWTEQRMWRRVELSEEDPARTQLSLHELRELASACGGPHVTIYLPTHEPGADEEEVQQDPRRFEALVHEVEARLRERDLPEHRIESLLRPANDLLPVTAFWNTARRGLAVLLSDTESHVFKLPYEVDESWFVADRWRASPLLPVVEDDRFVLLAFSRARVRLYAGTRDGLEELPLGSIPGDLAAVVGDARDDGHGDREPELERFLHGVAVALPTQLPRRELPLVLAGVERSVAELRRHGSNLRIADEAVLGEPSDLTLAELHAAACECAQPLLQRAMMRSIERIAEQFMSARATADLATVLQASREGRCDVLLVGHDRPVWGWHDGATGRIEEHADRHPDDDDLLDLAVAYALERGTEVHALAPGEIPGDGVVAALLRY